MDMVCPSSNHTKKPKPVPRHTQNNVCKSACFMLMVWPFLLSNPRSKIIANVSTIPNTRYVHSVADIKLKIKNEEGKDKNEKK
jgi:hypothetical protein